MTRAYYIDRLRIFLTMLVIFHHSAIAFGASGGWYYISHETTHGITQMVLSWFMSIDQAYFMSFFFFISALLMPGSYDRKGLGKFMKDRLVRLGIPLAAYILLIHPTLVYSIFKYLGRETGPWYGFLWTIITKHAEPGPMWFVLTLLVFETAYALYRQIVKQPLYTHKLPSAWGIVTFMVVMGLAAFGTRFVYPIGKSFFGLQFGFFPLYLGMYATGIVAGRNNWADRLTVKHARPWFIVSLLAVLFLIVNTLFIKLPGTNGNFAGGMNWVAFTYAMWEPIVCVGFCFFLLTYFKKKLSAPNKFVLASSSDSYTAYIIHPLLVVWFTFVAEKMAWPPLARLAFVLMLAIPTCFFVARLIRKIPGMKKIL